MNSFLLISRFNNDAGLFGVKDFHFNGFYFGKKIKRIRVMGIDEELMKGEAYLLLLKEVRICEEVLEAELVKYRRVTEG